ncbi:MAG: winged helix-turn-helix transcriptional regulator [Planctomycetes bacterium]|nr:winged helix-turn-helix transcriptional regulator [Planctomycetota bacterium]
MASRRTRKSPSGTRRPKALQPPHTIGFVLRRAYFALNRRFAAEVAAVGVTPEQHGVLFVVGHAPGLSQREIAERLCSDANTIAALVQRMEAVGWLERSPDPLDARIQRVSITDAGRDKWKQSFAISSRWHLRAVAGFSESERERLFELLERLYENVALDAHSPPGSGAPS